MHKKYETMKLSGKVAIVTGSARGIGKAIALKFASEGAAVVVNAVHSEGILHVVDEIRNKGGTAIACQADVTRRADVNNLVKTTLENFQAIHILVNNAGIVRVAPLLEMTEEDLDAQMDVNLKGLFNCTQAVLGHMMKQRYGKIINISSGNGTGMPFPNLAFYGATKAGVIQLTKAIAMEAGPYGINVNSIAPGVIMTEMATTSLSKEQLEDRKTRAVLNSLGKPEDIANLALFLASEESIFITGQCICCDGGRHDRM